jgi:hypothetical protein
VKTWWLSFVQRSLPPGQQCVGVAIVEAPTSRAAIARAWQTGCNPGGEVGFVPLPDDALDGVADIPRDVLMDRAELERRGLI